MTDGSREHTPGSRTPARPTVAILGTGRMGGAIALRLAGAGYPLALWNRTPDRAACLGVGTIAASPAAAAREAAVVVSSLTDARAIRAAYLGTGGALEAARGRLFVEMSTAGADAVLDLAPRVAEAGGRLVDAPVLASPAAVRAGSAAILAGGDPGDVAAAREVLDAIGAVRHVGPLGAGSRLKLVANTMLAVVTAAAAELQVAGERAGLDPDDVFWALQRHAPALSSRRDGFVDDRHEPVLFALRDLRKDLALARELFVACGSPTPVAAAVREIVGGAAERDGDLEISAITRGYRRRAAGDVPPAR